MPTYYVAKFGNDSNNGETPGAAKLTILAAVQAAGSDGDTVEIIDEGTYAEDDIGINVANITIKHTASWLGRPVLDGEESELNAFDVAAANATYIGLEIKGYGLGESDGCVFNKGGAGYDTFHMSGCFIHNCSILGSHSITNTDAGNPTTLKQCIMFFDPYNVYNGITNSGYMEIENCLITSSTATRSVFLDYATSGAATASFSTFINRGNSTKPIVRASKVINCIITGSGMGIASDDHTYNLVDVETIPFRNLADDDLSATGSGDIDGEDPVFVDGTSVGSGIQVAPNYQLQESSPAIDKGVAYDSITVDLTGTTRPQGDNFDAGCFEWLPPDWTSYTSEPNPNFKDGFIIQNYTNLASNHKFRYSDDSKQAPFSVGTKGPSSIRERGTPYKTTK